MQSLEIDVVERILPQPRLTPMGDGVIQRHHVVEVVGPFGGGLFEVLIQATVRFANRVLTTSTTRKRVSSFR